VPNPGKLGGMSVILLMLSISVGAVLWSHTVGYRGSVSAAPTAVLLQKATPSKPTAVSTPSLTTSANLAGSMEEYNQMAISREPIVVLTRMGIALVNSVFGALLLRQQGNALGLVN
jgi:hypothetical protein